MPEKIKSSFGPDKSDAKIARETYGLPETATEQELENAIVKSNAEIARETYYLPKTATEQELKKAMAKGLELCKKEHEEIEEGLREEEESEN